MKQEAYMLMYGFIFVCPVPMVKSTFVWKQKVGLCQCEMKIAVL